MVKGYETQVDAGMIAAGRLQAMIDSRAGATRMVDMIVKADRWVFALWWEFGNWPIG
jgi:hypothetical protein